MEKALLEEHIRYGEARFRDKGLVRPFVNRIYQDVEELEAMRPKTCEGCEHEMLDADCFPCSYCIRSYQDRYEPKEKL